MSIITPSTAIDLSKLEERDWPASLEMLDWDSTGVVFTKRSLIEFLNLHTGITVDPDFTNIAKLPRYAKFRKMTTAEAGNRAVKADSNSAAQKDSKASHDARTVPSWPPANIFDRKNDGDTVSDAFRKVFDAQSFNSKSTTTASEPRKPFDTKPFNFGSRTTASEPQKPFGLFDFGSRTTASEQKPFDPKLFDLASKATASEPRKIFDPKPFDFGPWTTANEPIPQRPGTTKNLVHRAHVTLEDLYKGKTTKFSITRNGICSKCNGKGETEDEAPRPACNKCDGRGTKVSLRQTGPTIEQVQSPCEHCQGRGEVVKEERCAKCNGNKVLPEKKILEVNIDKGMKAGQKIEFRGETDRSPNAEPGDVVVVIEEKPHDRFRRQGDNLITEVGVDLLTALAGGQFAIKHLNGRVLIVRMKPGGTGKHNEMKVVRGQGMPSQQHHEPGDLYIKINVALPTIDQASVPLLERALPPRIPIEKFEKDVLIEEVTLDDTTAGGTQNERMDDGRDEPRPQCQTQ